MRILGGKIVKISAASGAPSPDPRVVTPTCYYDFPSSFLLHNTCYCPQRKKITTVQFLFYSSAFVSFALFALVFHFKIYCLCWRGRKNISCLMVQGTLAMPLT